MNKLQTTIIDSIKNTIQQINVDSLKIELITDPANLIYVTQISDQSFDLGYLINFNIAMYSTGIIIYERIKRHKIGAKILSLSHSPNSVLNWQGLDKNHYSIKGQQYFFKLSF